MKTDQGQGAVLRQRLSKLGVAVALAASASASQALELKLSGQVNRILSSVNDGDQSRLFFADNINSQTRLRLIGTQEVAPGLKAGLNWEVGYTSNPSNAISMSKRSVDATFNERHAEIFLEGFWGKASLGQGDGAANGGIEVDQSGTTVISYSGVTDIGAGFAFRSGSTVVPTIGSTTANLDFESRYDRLRYDTPVWGGVTLATSFGTKGENDVTEIAARSDHALAGGRLKAALGWSREGIGGAKGNEETIGGSISWLAANGLNLTLATSTSSDDAPGALRHKFSYAKVGYIHGKHAVSIDFGNGKDFAAADDRSRVYGIGYVYAAAKWLDLYGGVKQHSLDRNGASFDNVRFVTIGTRVKF